MSKMKQTLISLALLLSVVGSAQTISVRSLEPTHKDVVELEVYDTTFVHLDFAKLIDNPDYYNNQKVIFSPNISEDKTYDYYEGFTVVDYVEMRDYPDTIWFKKRKKVKPGDYQVKYPQVNTYMPHYVENGIVRKLFTPVSILYPSINKQSGFFTPRELIDGKSFTITGIRHSSEDNTGRRLFEITMLDDTGQVVIFNCRVYVGLNSVNDYSPSIMMMSYIEKLSEKYVGKKFHAKDPTFLRTYLFKDLATGKYEYAAGDLICTDISLVKGKKSDSLRYDDDYYDFWCTDIRLFFTDSTGKEFSVDPNITADAYRYSISGLNKTNLEGYEYSNMYYEVQLDDLILAEDYYAQKEAERIAEENRIAEEQRKQAERKASLIKKYGKTYADLILQGKVRIGMSAEMCREAWGTPDDINRSSGIWGVHEQWCYDWGGYLYMENGKLTAIQN